MKPLLSFLLTFALLLSAVVLPAGVYTMTVSGTDADGTKYAPRTCTVKIKAGVQRKADVLLNTTGDYAETGFIDIEKEALVSLPDETYAETGAPITPAVTVTDGGEVLTEGVDYTVEYEDNVSWGYGYAKVKGIGAYTGHYNAPFYIQPKPQEDPGHSVLLPGDVSGDGQVTAEDARLALRGAVGLETYEPGSAEFKAADADRDNELTAGDARLILRAAVGLETLA